MERRCCAAVRLWWMWFWEGESGIRPPAFLLWYLYTPFYHPLALPADPAPDLRSPPPTRPTLPSSLLYQLPPRQPSNLSFVSPSRQLRLSQVDTQLQNIQFERKVKTKWIFQREYSHYQKSTLSLFDDCDDSDDSDDCDDCERRLHVDSRSEKMQITKLFIVLCTFSYIVQSNRFYIYSSSRMLNNGYLDNKTTSYMKYKLHCFVVRK